MARLYPSIDKLPLEIFIKCVVEQSYHALCISGKATNKYLSKHWDKLVSEYLDIVGDDTFVHSLHLTNDINRRSLILTVADASLQLLSITNSEKAKAFLASIGHIVPDNYTEDDLQAIRLSIEIEHVEVKEMNMQLNEMKHDGSSTKPTYQFYDKQIANIEIGLGLHYPINPATTMVSKFATWVVMLREKYSK